jgi:hypothetical protein
MRTPISRALGHEIRRHCVQAQHLQQVLADRVDAEHCGDEQA